MRARELVVRGSGLRTAGHTLSVAVLSRLQIFGVRHRSYRVCGGRDDVQNFGCATYGGGTMGWGSTARGHHTIDLLLVCACRSRDP